jgi:hypothetical protein
VAFLALEVWATGELRYGCIYLALVCIILGVMLVFLPIHVCCGFFLVEKKLFGMVVVWIFSSQGILGDDDGSGDGVIDVLGSVPWFLFFPRIMLGLDLFPVGCLSRLFCFLSDSYVGGGWGRVAVVVRVVHDDGVICRGIGTNDVFFCVGVRILCELHCTVRTHIVSGGTGTIALDVVAGAWRIVLTLQGDFNGCGVEWNCLVRLLLHLLVCTGWCSSIPLAGQC